MASSSTKQRNDATAAHLESERPASNWRIWKAITILKEDVSTNPMMAEPYRSTTLQVAAILEQWGYSWAGDNEMASFLNKKSLHHEAEESIVALYYLRKWMETKSSSKTRRFIAVDVCGGKGFFSMLLSYMTSNYWQPNNSQQDIRCLDTIILLEKCTPSDIDWTHIHKANAREKEHPEIVIWSGTNLHQYDALRSRLQTLSTEKGVDLALTGIHLCKMLSPSLVSLANGLGCPYLCLAPCCLPRIVCGAKSKSSPQAIPIHLYETQQEQQERLEHNCIKLVARNNSACFYCQKKHHWVKQCPDLQLLCKEERDQVLDKALSSIPCWICGMVGHFRSDCPTPKTKITTRNPPTVEMDVSNVIQSETPFEDYCSLLARYIQLDGMCQPVSTTTEANNQPVKKFKAMPSNNVRIIEAGLTGNKSGHDDNWNSRRKSIFLVATSS